MYSSLNLYRDAGTLLVYAGTAPGTAAPVVDLRPQPTITPREQLGTLELLRTLNRRHERRLDAAELAHAPPAGSRRP